MNPTLLQLRKLAEAKTVYRLVCKRCRKFEQVEFEQYAKTTEEELRTFAPFWVVSNGNLLCLSCCLNQDVIEEYFDGLERS